IRAALISVALLSTAAQAQDWKTVGLALGRAGSMQPGDVYKVGFPRTDLHVRIGNVVVKPTLALGSWVALKAVNDSDALLMGDLVLTEGELPQVMSKLQEGGIEQTAVHNHLLGESPRVLYMHIMGRGAPAKLAAAVRAALALTGTPLGPSPTPTATPALGLDTTEIGRAHV